MRTKGSPNKAPLALAAMVEDDFLQHAAGSVDIRYDDLVIAVRTEFGGTLAQAHRFLSRHLPRALAHLREGGWRATKATSYWWDVALLVVPVTEPEIKRCIAGPGKPAIGLHFTVTDNDFLFVYSRDFNIRNGVGKVVVNLDDVEAVAEAGLLSSGAVDVAVAGIKDTRKQVRRLRSLAAS